MKQDVEKIRANRYWIVYVLAMLIGVTPFIGHAESVSSLLVPILPGEPWDRNLFTLNSTVRFNPTAGDATLISKVTLTYFTSADCSGTPVVGTIIPAGSYTTPNGTSYSISTNVPFGLDTISTFNVGVNKVGTNMAAVGSIAVILKSTNNNTPQGNFTGSACGTNPSFCCVPVTCLAGECTSALGEQNFTLNTTAAVGDPADGGVIACTGGGLNNLVVPAIDNGSLMWDSGSSPFTPTNTISDTDGSANTAAIVTALGTQGQAAYLCSTYATTGGYTTGWFLPAKNQLNCLYTNQIAIGGFGFGTPYWTSTEVSTDNQAAWSQFFVDGSQVDFFSKDAALDIRCARSYVP